MSSSIQSVARFISLLSFFLLGVAASSPRLATAEELQVYRVGILNPNSATIAAKYIQAFREELTQRGYTEGRNLVIESRYADGQSARLPGLAKELAQRKVNVIFAPTEPALLAAKEMGEGIPIVTVTCDPLEKMLGSLARPGGNATGFSCVSSALAGKRLSFLKGVVPNLKRVALLYSASDAYEPDLRNVETSAQTLGLSIFRVPVKSASDFDEAFSAMSKNGSHALYIALSGFTNFHRGAFAQLALRTKLPSIFGFREFPEEGGLMSYGASASDGYRRAAYFVDRILKGALPSELPAEEPTRFELVLNARTAAALAISIPNEILIQANEIIR